MADKIAEQFPSENGVSPQERGTSTQLVRIVPEKSADPQKNPWSKYFPFAKGTELLVEGKIGLLPFVDIPFSGIGKIDEITESELDFSVHIPVEFPAFPPGTVSVVAKITYVGEGSSNKADFSFAGKKQTKTISIQSEANERILTPPGGLQISTGAPSPFPESVEIREVRLIPADDRVEIIVDMAGLIPNVIIRVSKKPSAKR
jgi:hypothetical protein